LCASARGVFVIATSEMNRGGYRSRQRSENVDGLAAAAETRSIEYAATTLIALRGVKDHPELVDVEMSKNRLGRNLDFRVELDFDRATVREVAVNPEETEQDEQASKNEERIAKLADDLVAALLKSKVRITSRDQFVELVRGKNDLVRKAIARLLNDGRVERFKPPTKGEPTYFRVVSAQPGPAWPHMAPGHPKDGDGDLAAPGPLSVGEGQGGAGSVPTPNEESADPAPPRDPGPGQAVEAADAAE